MIHPSAREFDADADMESDACADEGARDPSRARQRARMPGFFDDILQSVADAVTARAEVAQSAMRRTTQAALRGTMQMVAGATVLATSIVLLLVGLAGALADLWHGPRWSGSLAVGILGLAALGVVVLIRRRDAARAARQDALEARRMRNSEPSAAPRAVDPRAWIRRHPWLSLGSGLVAGLFGSTEKSGSKRR